MIPHGLKGRLPRFVQRFIEERQFQVRVVSTLSDIFDQEQCIPQVVFFNYAILHQNKRYCSMFGNKIDCSLCVDDLCICYCSKNMKNIDESYNKI